MLVMSKCCGNGYVLIGGEMGKKVGIFHLPPKVVSTFQGTNPYKWGFHLRKCKPGNEACQKVKVFLLNYVSIVDKFPMAPKTTPTKKFLNRHSLCC